MLIAFRWDDRDTHYWPGLHLGGDATQFNNLERPTVVWNLRRKGGSNVAGRHPSGRKNEQHKNGSTVNSDSQHPMGLMWVDAVGGFLVTTENQITIGQAVPGTTVELPVLGDLSRRHAIVKRDGSDYVVHPIGVTSLNHQPLRGPARLDDGDEIGLGQSTVLRFRMANPLSSTARLDIISHHRSQPSADGVIMMAETCLLGPADDSHVVCRAWEDQLVLMPTDDGRFRFKAGSSVAVDGVATCDTGVMDWGSRLTGEDFALMLERL